MVERGGAQASGGHASGWRPVEERIDRAALLRRDPILFYDDLTLYESELDDNGSMVLSVKLRVGPQYWYVLLRYWLRVDGVLLRCVSQLLPQPRALTRRPRLRETRIFCNTADAAAQAGGATLLRERAFREETFEGLRERGAPATVAQYPDAETASQVLLAAGGPVKVSYERLDITSR